jgi:hypothetical protein
LGKLWNSALPLRESGQKIARVVANREPWEGRKANNDNGFKIITKIRSKEIFNELDFLILNLFLKFINFLKKNW